MAKIYSVYEAKARFSELLRRVRERGETIVVSYHGEPVAELRPVESAADETLEGRLRRMEELGTLIRSDAGREALRPITRRRGALRRFLDDRE